jgi:hypothetical protein
MQNSGSMPWHCDALKQRCPSCACAGAAAPASVLNATIAANNDTVLVKVLIMIAPVDAATMRRLACRADVSCEASGDGAELAHLESPARYQS